MRALLLVILCSAATLAQAAAPKFTHVNGPHRVGVRVVHQNDYSRAIEPDINVFGETSGTQDARPMQTLVWYPAQMTSRMPMKFIEYELTRLTALDFSVPAADIAKARERARVGKDAVPFGEYVSATDNSPEAAGKYPVVIYAPSYGAPAHENVDLCEYLASHGYIVIAIRSMGPRSAGMSDDVEGLEAQAADIAFLAAYAHTLPQADSNRLAVVGLSWGGLSNVFASARSSRIKALVSLDGSVRSHPQMIAAASYVKPARTAVPMLSIGSRPMSLETLQQKGSKVTSSYLNSMKYSDVYLATMQPMTHMNFSSLALRGDGDAQFTEYSRDEVANAYSWTLRYVKEFLDAQLKQDAGALAFMKNTPVKNGVPPHMMTMEIHPATASVPTDASFIKSFKGRGFKDAEAIYKEMLAQSPEFILSPPQLNNWGYQLLNKKNAKGAAELFKLAAIINPEYADVIDSLGEAYEAMGEKALAIRAYEQALAVDKLQGHAAARLKVLR
jgi:dienelactone hydrolase